MVSVLRVPMTVAFLVIMGMVILILAIVDSWYAAGACDDGRAVSEDA